jgi:hypothetical protein
VNSFENKVKVRDINLNVEYYYNPGERMVMYFNDGTGHPGEPPSAEIQAVYAGDVDIYELLEADILDYIEQKLIEIHG